MCGSNYSESLHCDVLKATILRAYELVPEAYRQKFGTHLKTANQTFVEFVCENELSPLINGVTPARLRILHSFVNYSLSKNKKILYLMKFLCI